MERLATSRYKAGSSVSVSNSAGSMPTAPIATSGSGSGMGMSGGSTTASQPVTTPMAPPSMGSSTGSSLSDIYTLQLEENELINSISSLNDQYRSLLYRFNKLLNRSVESNVVLPLKDFKDAFEPPMDSALKNNPMLTMLQFERESLEARRRMSDRMGYPMVGIGLKYSILAKNPASTSMMNGNDMLMPMVSVSLPIYRKKYKAIQQETEWLKTASSQNYAATLNAMQSDYQDALFSYRDAQRRVQLNESQYQLTEKSYQLQLKRFASSTASLAELLTISRQQLDYALKGMNARIDLLLAQAKIRQLTAKN
jgi:outer membrane protein TolC